MPAYHFSSFIDCLLMVLVHLLFFPSVDCVSGVFTDCLYFFFNFIHLSVV